MRFEITSDIRDKGKEMGIKWISKAFNGNFYSGKEQIDSSDFRGDDFANLQKVVQTNPKLKGARTINQRLKALSAMGKGEKINDLAVAAEELRLFIQKLPHHWLFVLDQYSEQYLPYLVTSIEYHPAVSKGEDYRPAYVHLKAIARDRGTHETLGKTFHRSDLFGGKTVREIIGEGLEMHPESASLVKAYEESLERYGTLRRKVGVQLTGKGTASVQDSRRHWSRTTTRVDKDGVAQKLVIEDDAGWGSGSPTVQLPRYLLDPTVKRVTVPTEDDEDGDGMTREELEDYHEKKQMEMDDAEPTPIPDHPSIRVFDLRQHEYLTLHVNQTNNYIYNRSIFDMVILPGDTKDIIDAMVVVGQDIGDDIVKGKGKGIVILSTGEPGTGKTLTAEAYSEAAKRPLYTIQCAQLGTSAESLEQELGQALARAVKWGALMCIDEADVYIRERGTDINQNAIVGVFLRLLEYYQGVLFLTSNLANIDDAIKSRCVLHVRYQMPDENGLEQSWALYAKQYGINLSADLIKELSKTYKVSHRTVKQLCRLARVLHERLSKPFNMELFAFLTEFQDIEGRE